jgi:hypothetical protein
MNRPKYVQADTCIPHVAARGRNREEETVAKFEEALAALDDYRLALMSAQHDEDHEVAAASFAGNGAFSAFSTPLQNVHATGVGIRVRAGKIVPSEFVLKVYVFDKQALGGQTPKITRDKFGGVEIDVEQLPVQMALLRSASRKATARAQATTPAQHQQRRRPVIGGLQISPSGANFVGTLGCLVRRGTQLFGLSNNHVMADTNRLPLGTSIVQAFGSNAADVFSRLSDFEPIRFPSPGGIAPRNRIDAAISAITDPTLVARGKVFGVPNYTPTLVAARPAMRVTKSGRTTGVTAGTVTAIRVNGVTVNYGTPQSPLIATFDNCVQIVGVGGARFSAPGDSGSAILEAATGRPLALLYAGSGLSTTACDIASVCSRFNVVPA